MAYCPRCGVEVEPGVTACPLCDAAVPRVDDEAPATSAAPARWPALSDAARRPRRRLGMVRRLLRVGTSAAVLSAALVSVTADLLPDRRLDWSPYAVTGLTIGWGFALLVLTFMRHPAVVITGQAVATAGFLLLVDLFDGGLDWFATLALPVTGIVTAACLATWLAARTARRAPATIAAAVLVVAAAACVGIDLVVALARGAPSPRWSLIVVAAVLPPTALLVALRRRLPDRGDLRRLLDA